MKTSQKEKIRQQEIKESYKEKNTILRFNRATHTHTHSICGSIQSKQDTLKI